MCIPYTVANLMINDAATKDIYHNTFFGKKTQTIMYRIKIKL